jgi:hypothetical protein
MKERADDLTPSLTSLRASLRDISQSLQDIQTPERKGMEKTYSLESKELERIISLAVELPGCLRDIVLLEGLPVGLEKARGVWGSMESVLATWDEAGIPGAKEIMNECRHVLRKAQPKA